MKNCYNKSFLEVQEAFNIIKEMQKKIGKSYFNKLPDYYETIKKIEEERIKRTQEQKQARIDEKGDWIKRAKQLYSKSPRSNIVSASYYICIVYKDPADILKGNRSITFEEYDRKMKKYMKEKILEDLLVYIERLLEPVGEAQR